MNPVAQLLTDAKDLIPTPNRWTQEASARDDYGTEVDPISPKAVCFCMTGALARARHDTFASDDVFGKAHSLLPRATDYQNSMSVPKWNDDPSRTHKEVLMGFDEAIAKARKLS